MTLTINQHDALDGAERNAKRALWRGFNGRCPACGRGRIASGYLKIAPNCPACNEDLSHQRADDAPPYFTISIVGHIIIPLVLVVEKLWHPDMALHASVAVVATLALTFWLMPRVKGAVVGFQWANRMHGFGAAIGTDAT